MAPRRKAAPVVTAAATRINLAERRIAQKQKAPTQPWQKEAWAYFREVPEVGYVVRWSGNAMAKLRLFVGTKPPGAPREAPPVPVDDDDSTIRPDLATAAMEELERLRSPIGGQPQILKTINSNFEVVGECYLVGLGVGPMPDGVEPIGEEEWGARSTSEVDVRGGKYRLKDNPTDRQGRELEEPRDAIIRLWEPDPEWSNLADAPMRQLLGDLRALQVLSNQVIAEGLSRHNAGLLLIPNEITSGPPDPTIPEDDLGTPQDKVKADILDAVTTPIDDPSAAYSVMPLPLFGEAQYLKEVRHVSFSRTSDASLDARIQARVERVARGLNAPVEVVMGHQQTTFANAEQVDQDAFEDHLEGRCLLLVDALTVGYLRPNLVAKGFDAEEVKSVVVWYDPSALIASPNSEEHADSAWDRLTISNRAYRRATGYAEDDAPDDDELAMRIALSGDAGPQAVKAAVQRLDPTLEIPEAPLPPVPAAPGDTTPAAADTTPVDEPAATAATTNGHGKVHALARATPNPGMRLMEIDRELRTRLLVAADKTMARALDNAANRARARKRSASAKTMTAAIEPDSLLDGAFDGLEEQFMAWGARAQEQALGVVNRLVGGFSTARRDELKLRQAENLAEAWTWMRDTLHDLGLARLADPNPAAPLVGEIDPSLSVPPGMVRQAIARAGGAAGLQTQDGGAWITLADGGLRPAGGIGTGELVQDALRDEGAGIEAYEWVYGPAFRARPFEPHLALDGIVFENFDSEALANTEGWPEVAFYMPGDHEGCICDVAPVIVPPSELEG